MEHVVVMFGHYLAFYDIENDKMVEQALRYVDGLVPTTIGIATLEKYVRDLILVALLYE